MRRPSILSIGILLAALPFIAGGSALYVSTTGSDTTGDGSSAKPYATIQKAVWVANGTSGTAIRDTIYVLPGTYAGFWNESRSAYGALPARQIKVYSYDQTSGTAGMNWRNTIINRPGPNGEPWVAPRSDSSYSSYGYILSGFWLQGAGRTSTAAANFAGSGAQGVSNGIPVISNCVISGCNYGVKLDRRGCTVDNSLIYDNNYAVYLESTQADDKRVVNSTLTANNYGVYNSYPKAVDVYNSIVWGNSITDYAVVNMTQAQSYDHTIRVYGSDLGTTSGTGATWAILNRINAIPSFVGGTGPDQYRLQTSSTCKDAGMNGYASPSAVDLWGNVRIQGAAVDIGAMEIAAAPSPPVLTVVTPTEGQKFDNGLCLSASAFSPTSSITKIEFYGDGVLMNTAATSAADYIWANPSVGNHTVSIKAYDAQGLTTTSPDIHVSMCSVGISFSDDESFVSINYTNGSYNFRRPVVSPWKYTPSHTYWVATTGDDTSGDGSSAKPYKTIQKGVDAASAGDVVYVKAGTYTAGFKSSRSGSSGSPITISCEPGALGKVIVNPDVSWYGYNPATDRFISGHWNQAYILHGYIRINGLVLVGPISWASPSMLKTTDYAPCGVYSEAGTNTGSSVTNCVIYGFEHCGVKSNSGSGYLLEGNVIFHGGRGNLDHGVYFPTSDHTINGNIIFDVPGAGLHLYYSPDNITVTRNICFNCKLWGILCATTNSRFYNNVCTNNGRGFAFFGGWPTGNTVKNNIFSNNVSADFDWSSQGPGSEMVDYNCCYPLAPDTPGAHAINVDPKLTAPATGDYLPASGSPCINAGVNVGLPYSGSAPDMGPFEADQPQVRGRYIFYNNSRFDGNDPAANAVDDGAIATDKSPLYPNHTAAFKNYTSYSRGINGIMIDIANLPAGTPAASDFAFKVGNDSNPAAWAVAPSPTSVTVRRGAGVGGSDRVTILWADNAIQKQWLQVTVPANSHTGLSSADVFYWGNAIGQTGKSPTDAMVTPADEIAVRNSPHTLKNNAADITDPCDFNRDGKVGPTDEIIARNNATNSTTALKLIAAP